MVNKYCVVDCRSNYAGKEQKTVFFSPKEQKFT